MNYSFTRAVDEPSDNGRPNRTCHHSQPQYQHLAVVNPKLPLVLNLGIFLDNLNGSSAYLQAAKTASSPFP